MSPNPDKDALKQLRQERQVSIDRARRTVKAQNKIIKDIKARLAGEGATVPAMAQALKMKTAEVLLYVSALRKYGEVVEGPKDGDYFTYRLAE